MSQVEHQRDDDDNGNNTDADGIHHCFAKARRSLDELPLGYWDDVVTDLRRQYGMATIHLPIEIQELHERAFQVARMALDRVRSSSSIEKNDGSDASATVRMIQQGDDSAHATGYHCAGGSNSMSRYNEYREGFVFSNGETFQVPLSSRNQQEREHEEYQEENFEYIMGNLFETSLHGICNNILLAIERNLQLPTNYFQKSMGPTNTCSQWHIKRYVVDANEQQQTNVKDSDVNEEEQQHGHHRHRENIEEMEPKVLLPTHTDPSLVSIVIHDQKGCNLHPNGLQYYAVPQPRNTSPTSSPSPASTFSPTPTSVVNGSAGSSTSTTKRCWIDVPYSGHAVATIFVGSILSYITGSSGDVSTASFPSVKHRVIQTSESVGGENDDGRMAITLFVRPQPSSILQILPSPLLTHVKKVRRQDMTFHEWNTRVSKNYMKKSTKNTKERSKS